MAVHKNSRAKRVDQGKGNKNKNKNPNHGASAVANTMPVNRMRELKTRRPAKLRDKYNNNQKPRLSND